jgi:hypothetical protein
MQEANSSLTIPILHDTFSCHHSMTFCGDRCTGPVSQRKSKKETMSEELRNGQKEHAVLFIAHRSEPLLQTNLAAENLD